MGLRASDIANLDVPDGVSNPPLRPESGTPPSAAPTAGLPDNIRKYVAEVPEEPGGDLESAIPSATVEELEQFFGEDVKKGAAPGEGKPFFKHGDKEFKTAEELAKHLDTLTAQPAAAAAETGTPLARLQQRYDRLEQKLTQMMERLEGGGQPGRTTPTAAAAADTAPKIPKPEENPYKKEDQPIEHMIWENQRQSMVRDAEIRQIFKGYDARLSEHDQRQQHRELIAEFDSQFKRAAKLARIPEAKLVRIRHSVMRDENLDADEFSNLEELVQQHWSEYQSDIDAELEARTKAAQEKGKHIPPSGVRRGAAPLVQGKKPRLTTGDLEGSHSFYNHLRRQKALAQLSEEE